MECTSFRITSLQNWMHTLRLWPLPDQELSSMENQFWLFSIWFQPIQRACTSAQQDGHEENLVQDIASDSLCVMQEFVQLKVLPHKKFPMRFLQLSQP